MLSAATERLVQGYFTLRELGVHRLKGLSHPSRCTRLSGKAGYTVAFKWRDSRGLTHKSGEFRRAAALQRWHNKKGTGQVVLVSGEAGIGKSRLVHALIERLAVESYARLDFRCSPYYQHSALYPVSDLLQRACGLKREDTPAVKLEKLEAALAPYRLSPEEIVPCLPRAALPLAHTAFHFQPRRHNNKNRKL